MEDAKTEVAEWKEYVEAIQSMHKRCGKKINWGDYLNEPEPTPPERRRDQEEEAKRALSEFKPSLLDQLILDWMFSRSDNKVKKLEQNVIEAIASDEYEYSWSMAKYERTRKEWLRMHQLASGVISRDAAKYEEAIKHFDPFSELRFIGENVTAKFRETWGDVDFHAHTDDVIPDYTLSLTTTGKVSKKKTAKSAFNELYQDHVCSSLLRVAREVFRCLPVEYVRVNAVNKFVNPSTGHLEARPFVSVLIPFATLAKLNLKQIDPSESLKNFNHQMKFSKVDGFSPVERVSIPNDIE